MCECSGNNDLKNMTTELTNKFTDYLPLTGGILTGKLKIWPGSAWSQIQIGDNSNLRLHKIHCNTTEGTNSSMQFEVNRDGTNDNRTIFQVRSNDDGSVPSNTICFTNYINGESTYYNLYGDHNRDAHIHSQNLRMNDGENIAIVMKCLADSDSASNYGSNLLIGANGCCYIGGGESYSSLYSALGNTTGEHMYVCADANIALAPNCNTIENRKLIWINGTQFYPATSGSHTLGTSTYKWGQIYSTASSISTSDANQKHDIGDLDDKAVDFVLALHPKSYKFNDGTSNRKHWGLIAQDVEELMSELDISSENFAGFIKSPKEKISNETTGELELDLDENGNIQYEYALRYEEFIAPLIKTVQYQKEEIDRLKEEINILRGLILYS